MRPPAKRSDGRSRGEESGQMARRRPCAAFATDRKPAHSRRTGVP